MILSLFLSIYHTHAQQLDDAFLDSLPEDVKEDLMKRSDEQSKEAEDNYRPSQYSSKLQQAEELIDLKIRIEADLRELEKRLQSDDTLTISKELNLFGSDFFNTFQTSFMPINEPNPDANYRLDVGDVLNIQITGQKDLIQDFSINGDGSINIPDIGKLVLVGLNISEASQLVKSRVNSAYIGAEAFVSLSQLRDVNVLITGNAENPGIYTLSGNSNILQAISIAGGVSEYGSYREINLVRDNNIIEVLDVYDLLINGNFNLQERLRSGDVIFIEPRKSIVTIDGAVKRPAKYELNDEENLDVVIDYANGFKQTADTENIYLERILDGTLKSIPILSVSQFDSIESIDGDLIYIREYPYRTATISGAVLKPGTYTMAAGENLDDLIIKAGGFTDNAYPFGAVFQNKEAKAINKKAQELLYQEFLDNIIALSQQNISGNFDITPIVGLTQEINDLEPNGRIVVDMTNEDARRTLGIQEGDNLVVPEKTNNVYVYGEVSSEGSVMFAPNQSVDFFINKSGGYKKYADNESIYILHPNGETDRYSKRRNIFENQPRSGITIYPGSVIFVPRKIDNSSARTLAAQAYVTILGNLGLALASLNSIDTNWFQWKMFFKKKEACIKKFLAFLILLSFQTLSDSFDFNTYNNHGIVGLINMPTARFYDEAVHGISVYDSEIDQKITLSSNPYDWFEASFFYMNLEQRQLCRAYFNVQTYCQGYKDKGFNVKVRIKEEGVFPAIAVGLMDFAGTGKYSSEYIVSSYGIGRLDMHLGIGWGALGGSNKQIKNPFGYLKDSFNTRGGYASLGGQLNLSNYFSGENASPFYGMSYSLNDRILLKFEKDTILDKDGGSNGYPEREIDYSFGVDYSINSNFTLGFSYERGGYSSLRFVYKNNPQDTIKKYEYRKAEVSSGDDKYTKLIKNLEENGIGVTKISETSRSIGLELTQFIHPDLNLVEQIIAQSSRDAGIKKSIKKDLKISDLTAISEIDDDFERRASIIYERQSFSGVNSDTKIRFRPFIASREEFFKGALLLENDTEYIIRENLFFNTNLKYSLANNFEDLRFPPVNTFPAQVRSDIKQYLKNMDDGILIGRAQLDYHITPRPNHHLMFTAGILEDMFSGYGTEYLYFRPNTNYSFGLELFNVKKRDYYWGFGHLDYENITATANFYYRNYGTIPFDMKISAGEYLAGDVGSTIEFSRTFRGGVRFGAFASFTDVSSEDFGEGSFDKGIFFNIPIYGNLINYTWRPLTKDPGAKLLRHHNLHDLLVRFKSIN